MDVVGRGRDVFLWGEGRSGGGGVVRAEAATRSSRSLFFAAGQVQLTCAERSMADGTEMKSSLGLLVSSVTLPMSRTSSLHSSSPVKV